MGNLCCQSERIFHFSLLDTVLYNNISRISHRITAKSRIMRVHNRFGGMRHLANFCGDIRHGS